MHTHCHVSFFPMFNSILSFIFNSAPPDYFTMSISLVPLRRCFISGCNSMDADKTASAHNWIDTHAIWGTRAFWLFVWLLIQPAHVRYQHHWMSHCLSRPTHIKLARMTYVLQTTSWMGSTPGPYVKQFFFCKVNYASHCAGLGYFCFFVSTSRWQSCCM